MGNQGLSLFFTGAIHSLLKLNAAQLARDGRFLVERPGCLQPAQGHSSVQILQTM